MPALTPAEWTALVGALMLLAVLLWLLPSCGDATCVASHARHVGAERAANAQRTHDAYHDPEWPNPLCALCAAKKRDERDEKP